MSTVAIPAAEVPLPTAILEASSADVPEMLTGGPDELSDREIAARAFELYCARGCEDGHDVEDWLQAERDLREERGRTTRES